VNVRASFILLLALPLAQLSAADRSASFYQLHESLANQDGTAIDLDVYRGQKVLVTMFYSSCTVTCPLIIDTLRAVERALDVPQRQRLRVLLVSFDDERDMPATLHRVAQSRHIDTSRWTLAHADAAAVRRIAAALGVQYKKLPDGQFSHSTQITVLDGDGTMLVQSAVLGHADPAVLKAIDLH